jgi:hypothetical protein
VRSAESERARQPSEDAARRDDECVIIARFMEDRTSAAAASEFTLFRFVAFVIFYSIPDLQRAGRGLRFVEQSRPHDPVHFCRRGNGRTGKTCQR